MSYPKWMYHAASGDEPKLVKSAEHFASLNPGWADSPAAALALAQAKPAAPAPIAETVIDFAEQPEAPKVTAPSKPARAPRKPKKSTEIHA